VFLYKVLLPATLIFLIGWGTGLVKEHPAHAPIPDGISFSTLPVFAADPPVAELGTDRVPVGSMWINSRLSEVRILVSATEIKSLRLTGGGAIVQQYRVSEFVNTVFTLGVIMAISFQLPLVLMILSWVGIVEPRDLAPYRKQIVFGCAIAAALMPSQDPVTMVILWVVFYGLFELGVVLMKFVPARVVAGKSLPRTDGDQGDA